MASESTTVLSILPNDDHYLGLTLLVTVILQLGCFFIAYVLQIDKITDFAGSLNFILITLISYFGNTHTPRSNRATVLTILTIVCRAELAFYLLYRVLRRGKDNRFDSIRQSFIPFLIFWIFQIIWVYIVTLPVIFVNADTVYTNDTATFTVSDIIGIVLWIIGFLVQVIADFQKDSFRTRTRTRKENETVTTSTALDQPCTIGVWYYSRHPNYFGEILLWWGIFVLASSQFRLDRCSTWGYFTIISPLFTMFLLLIGSGIPTAEGDNQKRYLQTKESKRQYLQYREQTSPLIPLPPTVYKILPLWLKRYVLFEWQRYETDWNYVGNPEQQQDKPTVVPTVSIVTENTSLKG